MKVMIPSYGRPDSVKSYQLFDSASIVVPHSQEALYRANYDRVISIPDNMDGNISIKRNAILDFGEDVFMCDDDLVGLRDLNTYHLVTNLDTIVENLYQMAKDMGVGLFGFNITENPLRYKPMHPFSLTKQMYGAVGVLKDEIRYDKVLRVGEDVDFYLQKLKEYRAILRANWLCPVTEEEKSGGVRDISDRVPYFLMLEQKWGSRIVRVKPDNTMGLRVPILGI